MSLWDEPFMSYCVIRWFVKLFLARYNWSLVGAQLAGRRNNWKHQPYGDATLRNILSKGSLDVCVLGDPLLGTIHFSDSACVALRPQKPRGLLWAGSPGRPPRLTFTLLLRSVAGSYVSVWLYVHTEKSRGLLGTGSPGRPSRLSHSSWALDWRSIESSGLLTSTPPPNKWIRVFV